MDGEAFVAGRSGASAAWNRAVVTATLVLLQRILPPNRNVTLVTTCQLRNNISFLKKTSLCKKTIESIIISKHKEEQKI